MNMKANIGATLSSSAEESVKDAISILSRVAISRATDLARTGQYAQAEDALGLIHGTSSPLAMDLLARIRAQQGRLAEAQALWTEAIRLDPNNEAYRSALQRLSQISSPSSWGYFGRGLTWFALSVVVLVVFVSAFRTLLIHERETLASERRKTLPSPRPETNPSIDLQLQGVSQRTEGNAVVLRFDSGLFKRSDVPTPQAVEILTRVGQRLEQAVGKSSICVVGYSDDRPLTRHRHFRDNTILSLARAHSAATLLASSGGIPASQIVLQSASGPIFPNDSPENRARNRTVEIRIESWNR